MKELFKTQRTFKIWAKNRGSESMSLYGLTADYCVYEPNEIIEGGFRNPFRRRESIKNGPVIWNKSQAIKDNELLNEMLADDHDSPEIRKYWDQIGEKMGLKDYPWYYPWWHVKDIVKYNNFIGTREEGMLYNIQKQKQKQNQERKEKEGREEREEREEREREEREKADQDKRRDRQLVNCYPISQLEQYINNDTYEWHFSY